jgi:putative phosphoribosyl transferase
MKSFVDRREAGRPLAARLSAYANRPDVIVFGVPRGGIPVAASRVDRRVAEREKIAVDCMCVMTPDPFYRIGVWYEDSVPVSDASVLVLIDGAARQPGAAA